MRSLTALASRSRLVGAVRSCRRCGRHLDHRCGRCGSACPSAFAFCTACGEPVDGAGPADPPGQLRTVTVLFVDIVGSTALVDRLTPHAVRALQHDYFRTVARVVRRWDGVVEKYVGDAVMAVFGAVGGDDAGAYRAVRAGLQVQEALGCRPLAGDIVVRVRVGVATGEAVVDPAALCDRGQALVSGGVVTTAARVQQHAPGGAVVVTAATRRATTGRLDYQSLPAARLPGLTRPVEIWRALGAAPARVAA